MAALDANTPAAFGAPVYPHASAWVSYEAASMKQTSHAAVSGMTRIDLDGRPLGPANGGST